MKIFYITLLTLLTALNATVASSRDWNRASLEIVAETDGSAELSGFHFIKNVTDSASNFSGYFGGALFMFHCQKPMTSLLRFTHYSAATTIFQNYLLLMRSLDLI